VSDEKRRMTLEEWQAEGRRRFGPDPTRWRFTCPSCGQDQDALDWRSYGCPTRAIDANLAFNCVGTQVRRVSPGEDVVDFMEPSRGHGCTYVGAGLWRISPVVITAGNPDDRFDRELFEFAQPKEAR